jgi:hypothetical protein
MGLKHDIIDMAVSLLHLLGHCDDKDFFEYIIEAIYNNDTMSLYDLEDSLDE